MDLQKILDTDGCQALNDWLMLNFGQTLVESIIGLQHAIDSPEEFDSL